MHTFAVDSSGSIFEAGFRAVSGGAAQAAALKPSASGEQAEVRALIFDGAYNVLCTVIKLFASRVRPDKVKCGCQEHLKVHLNACHLAGD